jgi:hypothetical protein
VITVDKATFGQKALSGVETMEKEGVWSPGLYQDSSRQVIVHGALRAAALPLRRP